jgi:hypothetical protein
MAGKSKGLHALGCAAILVALGVSAEAAALEPDSHDEIGSFRPDSFSTGAVCTRGESAEIVVCGKSSDRYRIPEQIRAESVPSGPGIRSNMPLQAGDVAPCGIFEGQRHCGKREAAQYGYGAGRDPITFARHIFDALMSPSH